jgi:hypothetical protein
MVLDLRMTGIEMMIGTIHRELHWLQPWTFVQRKKTLSKRQFCLEALQVCLNVLGIYTLKPRATDDK